MLEVRGHTVDPSLITVLDSESEENWKFHIQTRSTVAESRPPPDPEPIGGYVPILVADVITESERTKLRAEGRSFFDRRGLIYIRNDTLRVEIATAPADSPAAPRSTETISARSERAVAIATLLSPGRPPGIRDIARREGMSPSTIHAARARLIAAALLDEDGRALHPDLFWSLADAWYVERVPLAAEPVRFSQGTLPLGSASQATATTDTVHVLAGDHAAQLHGAPIMGIDEEPRSFYVEDRSQLANAIAACGRSHDWQSRRASIAVAPSALAVFEANRINGELLVPAVVAALDLAVDTGRGRTILGDWDHPELSAAWTIRQ
jgi:hypothetical protein